MATWVWILIAIAVLVIIGLFAMGARRRRTAVLRQRFGPEYDRTLRAHEDRRAAEAELRARERQRAQLEIKPLPEPDRLRFADEWREVQGRFVDEPPQAVAAADTLVTHVMAARGYPMKDFEAQADLVSVDHPGVVADYRAAQLVRYQSRTGKVATEDLREAMLRYRSLFDELLRPDGDGAAASVPGQAGARQDEAGTSQQTAAGTAGDYAGGTGRSVSTTAEAPSAEQTGARQRYHDDQRMTEAGDELR
jgi:hypothetical protein